MSARPVRSSENCLLVCFFALFVSGQAIADNSTHCCTYPALPQRARLLDGFVPKGWRIEMKERGVISGDNRIVVAFILRETNPVFVEKVRAVDTNPRILAIAFATLTAPMNWRCKTIR
jgi:hypothetical protein